MSPKFLELWKSSNKNVGVPTNNLILGIVIIVVEFTYGTMPKTIINDDYKRS